MAQNRGPNQGLDPKLETAAMQLATALVSSPGAEHRELLWHVFRDRVAQLARELEEIPVREALDELEARGLNMEVLSRLAGERVQGREPVSRTD